MNQFNGRVLKLADLKERMSEIEIFPKKSFGQNFLLQENVIEKIISATFSEETLKFSSEVIEIGPGLGSLTELLLAKCKEEKKNLQLIEFDKKIANYWNNRGVKTTSADALKVNWQKLELQENTTLVSNLPYQISSGIVIERSIDPANINRMILMFQKEVAERIASKEGSKVYGLLSVIAQVFWQVETVVDAGPGAFYPPPKISSRVLSFQRKENKIFKSIDDVRDFSRMVKASFAYRRKLLRKNLNEYIKQQAQKMNNKKEDTTEKLEIGKISAEMLLSKLSLGEKVRAEEVSVENYLRLYCELFGRDFNGN